MVSCVFNFKYLSQNMVKLYYQIALGSRGSYKPQPEYPCISRGLARGICKDTRAKACMDRGNRELSYVCHENSRQISLVSYLLNQMIQAKLENTKEGKSRIDEFEKIIVWVKNIWKKHQYTWNICCRHTYLNHSTESKL